MPTVNYTGTVSRATMREEDLVPKFLAVLDEFAPREAARIRGLIRRELHVDYGRLISDYPAEGLEDKYEAAWRSEEMSYILNEDIWDAMQNIAPEGHYFGASEGDGSDFGFWSCEYLC